MYLVYKKSTFHKGEVFFFLFGVASVIKMLKIFESRGKQILMKCE